MATSSGAIALLVLSGFPATIRLKRGTEYESCRATLLACRPGNRPISIGHRRRSGRGFMPAIGLLRRFVGPRWEAECTCAAATFVGGTWLALDRRMRLALRGHADIAHPI